MIEEKRFDSILGKYIITASLMKRRMALPHNDDGKYYFDRLVIKKDPKDAAKHYDAEELIKDAAKYYDAELLSLDTDENDMKWEFPLLR